MHAPLDSLSSTSPNPHAKDKHGGQQASTLQEFNGGM
jgi:hypothetical protein